MATKVRVQQWGKPQGYAVVEQDATKGATIGVNVYWQDGSLVQIGQSSVSSSGSLGGYTPEVVSVLEAGTVRPSGMTTLVRPPPLDADLTIENPSSSVADGWVLVFELVDDGASVVNLTWESGYGNDVATLPSSTTLGKKVRVTVEFNASVLKYLCKGVVVQP